MARITENEIKESAVKKLKRAGFHAVAGEFDEGFKRPAAFVSVTPTRIERINGNMELVEDTIEVLYAASKDSLEHCTAAANLIRETLGYEPLKVKDRRLTISSMEFEVDRRDSEVRLTVEYYQEVPGDGETYEPVKEIEWRNEYGTSPNRN